MTFCILNDVTKCTYFQPTWVISEPCGTIRQCPQTIYTPSKTKVLTNTTTCLKQGTQICMSLRPCMLLGAVFQTQKLLKGVPPQSQVGSSRTLYNSERHCTRSIATAPLLIQWHNHYFSHHCTIIIWACLWRHLTFYVQGVKIDTWLAASMGASAVACGCTPAFFQNEVALWGWRGEGLGRYCNAVFVHILWETPWDFILAPWGIQIVFLNKLQYLSLISAQYAVHHKSCEKLCPIQENNC